MPGMTGWPERRTNAWGSHNARCSHISERSAHPSKAGDPITRRNVAVILMCMPARRKHNQRGRTWPGSEVGAGTATTRRSLLMMPMTIRIMKVMIADRGSLGVLARLLSRRSLAFVPRQASVREPRATTATPMPCEGNEIWVVHRIFPGTAEATCPRPRGNGAGCYACP
jgi:hypothetical protein